MSIGPAVGALIIGDGFDPFLFATAGVYSLSYILVLYILHSRHGSAQGIRRRTELGDAVREHS